jgi:hypothetical protein
MRPVMAISLVALVVSACSDSLGPRNIIGRWEEDFTVPGSSLDMDLTTSGSTVSGTGGWCDEAGSCGTAAVTGTVVGTAVHLNLDFTVTQPLDALGFFRQKFDGRITSQSSLEGSVTGDALSDPAVGLGTVRFHRI